MLLLSKFKVSGHSMEPNYKENDLLICSGVFYFFTNPKKGDVIILKDKSKFILKRIAKEKDGKYLVLGDNKKDSMDSRKFGWIIRKNILGKVLFKI